MHINLSARMDLFRELEDLKRQQPATYRSSLATTLFQDAWYQLWQGQAADQVARQLVLRALVALRLPGAEGVFFRESDLAATDARAILLRALQDAGTGRVDADLLIALQEEIPALVRQYQNPATRNLLQDQAFAKQCWFVARLSEQPRAGATKPGLPRLLLLPTETHADHCFTVAVFAFLLAPAYDATLAVPFLTGLSHHLHNALLPDCGFAGEVLLGDHLSDITDRGRNSALANLNDDLREQVSKAIETHEDLSQPEGRAASAADVLDRVLDVKWRVRAAQVTEDTLLGDLELVHEGPLQEFQLDLLKRTGLWQSNPVNASKSVI